MTVCVATICSGEGGSLVLGASDRMLTAGDIQFEPPQSKIIPLTSSIVAMVAGDSALQAEILASVQTVINARIKADPHNWWEVHDVAYLYKSGYNEIRQRRSEGAILAPLGLDRGSFVARQKELSPELARTIATELLNFQLPGAEVIFAGVDERGPHIYEVSGGDVNCQDKVGFAAIGAGYWHADSQLMVGGHAPSGALPETLLLAYSAKKRAEVAPGVGDYTDMFMIGPALGSLISVGDHVLDELKRIYERARRAEGRAGGKARERIKSYVEGLRATATAKEQSAAPENPGTDSAPDDEAARG